MSSQVLPPKPPLACNAPAIQEDLKAYRDRELSWLRQRVVRRHLRGCAACEEEMAVMERIERDLRLLEPSGESTVPLSAALRARVLSRIAEEGPFTEAAEPQTRRFRPSFTAWATAGTLTVAAAAVFLAYTNPLSPVPSVPEKSAEVTGATAAAVAPKAPAIVAEAESKTVASVGEKASRRAGVTDLSARAAPPPAPVAAAVTKGRVAATERPVKLADDVSRRKAPQTVSPAAAKSLPTAASAPTGPADFSLYRSRGASPAAKLRPKEEKRGDVALDMQKKDAAARQEEAPRPGEIVPAQSVAANRAVNGAVTGGGLGGGGGSGGFGGAAGEGLADRSFGVQQNNNNTQQSNVLSQQQNTFGDQRRGGAAGGGAGAIAAAGRAASETVLEAVRRETRAVGGVVVAGDADDSGAVLGVTPARPPAPVVVRPPSAPATEAPAPSAARKAAVAAPTRLLVLRVPQPQVETLTVRLGLLNGVTVTKPQPLRRDSLKDKGTPPATVLLRVQVREQKSEPNPALRKD